MNQTNASNLITAIRKLIVPKSEAAQKKIEVLKNNEIQMIYNMAFNNCQWGEVGAEELKKAFIEARTRTFDDFHPAEIYNNQNLFVEALIKRTKEILEKIEVDDSDLIKRQMALLVQVHGTGLTGKAAEIVKLEKDKIILELMRKKREIKVSFEKFQAIMNICEKSIFGDGTYFSLIEIKKGKKEIVAEFEKELLEHLTKAEVEEISRPKTPEEEEAEEQVFQAKLGAKIEENESRIEEIDAQNEAMREQIEKMMTDAVKSGDVETINKLKAIQADMLGIDDDEDILKKAG